MKNDIGRLSDPGLLILASLAGGPKHGYGMLEDIASFSGVRFEPGTLYGAVARLENEELIVALEPAGRRRPYALTAAGHRVLAARLATIERVAEVGRERLPSVVREARA
jgi:DNA-binding PadR family transcriptional regulator